MDNLKTQGVEIESVSSSTLFNDDTYRDGEVRMGTGKNAAQITFTLASPVRIAAIDLTLKQYKSYSAEVSVEAGSKKLTQAYTDSHYVFSLDSVDSFTISVTGGQNRVVLQGIDLLFTPGAQETPKPATIKVEKTGEGSILLDPVQGYMTGDTISVSAIPAEGYYLSSLLLNGESGTRLNAESYSFTIRDTENELVAVFRPSSQGSSDFSNLYANTSIHPDRGSQGTIDSYYKPIRGLKGEALKKGLHNLIKNHKAFNYGSLGHKTWETIDVDPFNSKNFYVTYQGSISKGYSVNKEHTWAKSHGNFGTTAPAGSDLHNLRGSNSYLNSTRGNLDFGSVEHSSSTSIVGRFKWAEESMDGNYVDGKYFEPKDEFKGDVARIIFYMATRYEGEGNEPDLEVDGEIDRFRYYDFTAGATGLHGNFSDLYRWCTSGLDPVSDYEVNRNNIVDQDYQHNRNPFIDHPEFVVMIYDKSYDGPGALNE